jgi:predicted amidophosphoribosyltransferase
MGRVERAEWMRNAFVARRTRAKIRGGVVILVDDILTTGSTCGAAARALKAAGAKRVIAAVIGRAEGRF